MTSPASLDPVVVAAARSPIGRARRGSLAAFTAPELSTTIVRAALGQVPGLGQLDDLLLGCAVPGTEPGGPDLARVVAARLGYHDLPGVAVARWCVSSMLTTRMACHAIRAGEGEVFVSAGVEVMSGYPKGLSLGGGESAERIADLRGITRAEADEFALRSHHLVEADSAFWKREITALTTPAGEVISTDDYPRPGLTLGEVTARPPVFRRPGGRVTGTNCSRTADGASALVLTSYATARARGITPLARIRSTGAIAVPPELTGLGMPEAAHQALHRAGLSLRDIDLFEINESFAVSVLAAQRKLGIPWDRLNVHGGGIAIGHPFGMTGARLIGTLLNSLQWHDKQLGLAMLCAAGGQAMAVVLERLT